MNLCIHEVLKQSKNDISEELIKLISTIGIENCLKLERYFGSGSIYIPKTDSILKNLRNRQIVEDYRDNGKSIIELSRKYRITGTAVNSILLKNN